MLFANNMNPLFLLPLFLFPFSLRAADRPMNELPMYGGQHDPQVEPNEANSKDAAALGWRYFYEGDDATAIKRFNQAWMFNRKNPDAFWGFGIIMGKRASVGDVESNLNESIKYLGVAHDLAPKNGRITGDLAFSKALLAYHRSAQGHDAQAEYEKAEELFQEAYRLDPKYPPIISNWAILKFYSGDYPAAKRLIKEAEGIGFKPDPEFIKELNEKSK